MAPALKSLVSGARRAGPSARPASRPSPAALRAAPRRPVRAARLAVAVRAAASGAAGEDPYKVRIAGRGGAACLLGPVLSIRLLWYTLAVVN